MRIDATSKWPLLPTLMGCLALAIILYSNGLEFFRYNSRQALDFAFSAHFAYFVVIGIILTKSGLSERCYNSAVYAGATIYLFLFYEGHLRILRMAGDNLCQIAYWNILFRPNLSGSIGASFTKPGQLLILGVLNQLGILWGESAFKVGLCLVMGACIWSLVRISADIGGRLAGIITFPLAVWAFLYEFLDGSSSIFLIPVLFIGMRLHFYHAGLKWLGRLLLVLSIHFHIYSIAVLGCVWLLLLLKKDWQELKLFTFYTVLSVLLWVAIVLCIQGEVARLNSGAAAGYVAPLEGIQQHGLAYMFSVLREGIAGQPYIRVIFFLMVLGISASVRFGYGLYLTVFASFLILVANVLYLGGTFNLERYCSTYYAFGCAVGVGVACRYAKDVISGRNVASTVCLFIAAGFFLCSLDFTAFNYYREAPPKSDSDAMVSDYVACARKVLAERRIPPKVRLMTEDDILYSLVVLEPDRFPALAALQRFNVASVEKRKEMLSRTDYIWIALTNGHSYYYLNYVPLSEWSADPFRIMIHDLLTTGGTGSLYGFSFLPVDMDQDRLILKVQAE